MHVDWSALGTVALVSLAGAVALIALFSLGVRGLGAHGEAGEHGRSGLLPLAGALLCFGLCAAVALGGVLLLAFPSTFG